MPQRTASGYRADLWPIDALGSGSDYTAFLDFTGVASLNLGYGGESDGGMYHSAYDDFYWFTHFGDTAFVYGRALAQTSGTAVMRLADADLLPFNFASLSGTFRRYVNELERLADSEANEIRERNSEITDGIFNAVADPSKQSAAPQPQAVPPRLDFGPLERAAQALGRSAEHYQRVVAAKRMEAFSPRASFRPVNQELLRSERTLTDANGLPGRPWYKHQLYAPGLYTGYAVKTVPAVREAIEQKQWTLAQQRIASVAQVIENEAATVERAANGIENARGISPPGIRSRPAWLRRFHPSKNKIDCPG